MSSKMTLDTQQVLGIASLLENDNKVLQELLNDSKASIDNLSNFWTGSAADETRESYNAFASKFFQTYHDILDQYVKFLRVNVADQYEQIEQMNTQLADGFK